MVYVTGIGSRNTPTYVCDAMERIGRFCKEHGILVRSGHASGADYAFELGARENTIPYLPWKGFNANLPILGKPVVYNRDDWTIDITKQFHPKYQYLKNSSKLLIERNCWQVLGPPECTPSKLVICWTRDGKLQGGTAQAIKIAKHFNIKVYNLADVSEFDILEKLKEIAE